jgi:hypothetical protein
MPDSATLPRYAGLLGAALLAGGGWLAGALPGPAPATRAEALWGAGAGFRLGLFACVAGLAILGWAWWRLGVALRAAGAAAPGRVLATGALWAAPLLLAPPLASRDVYAYACHGALWLDGHDPYAVGAAAGGCPWLATVPPVWHDATAPYGPLALVVSAAAVALARLLPAGDTGQLLLAVAVLRSAAVAGVVLVAAYLPRLARACGVDPAAALWLGVATPLVAVHAVAGAHHDALVAGLVVAALARAAGGTGRRGGPPPKAAAPDAPAPDAPAQDGAPARAAVAGALLGLAVAVKVTAIVAGPFALLLAAGGGPARAGRRAAPAVVAAVAAAATFAALTVATGLGTGWVRALGDTGSLAQWTSLSTGLGMAAGYALRAVGAPEAYDQAVAVARALGLAALAVLLAAVLLRAWRAAASTATTRTVVGCCGVALAAVVVLGPVVYPWYALAPLAVLAAATAVVPARRWLAAATLVFAALALPSGLGLAVLTKFPGALLDVAVVLALSWAWFRRRRRNRRPEPADEVPPERPAAAVPEARPADPGHPPAGPAGARPAGR